MPTFVAKTLPTKSKLGRILLGFMCHSAIFAKPVLSGRLEIDPLQLLTLNNTLQSFYVARFRCLVHLFLAALQFRRKVLLFRHA